MDTNLSHAYTGTNFGPAGPDHASLKKLHLRRNNSSI